MSPTSPLPPPIPVLEDYGLSPTTGFLPPTLPLTRLPDPYYNKWEAIAANLQAHVLSRRLRGVVDSLPVLSTVGLEHDAEWRRAYSLLCFIAHAYIWGGDAPADRLPASVSVPLLAIAARLEVPPVATYAAVCLWNFKPLFLDEPIDNLENLATLNTFTGSIDESWFYLVSVAIEARGGPILALMLTAFGAARRDDARTVTRCLCAFAERLTDLTIIMQRLYESCEPATFYHRIRPFLAGSKNMAEAGLPRGVLYEDGSGTETYRQYAGGSNAQSSLIQFFDIALGIHHRATGETPATTTTTTGGGAAPPPPSSSTTTKHGHGFIHEMRKYMPAPHARFLEDATRAANLREYVEAHRSDRALCLAYDACLAMLSSFRDKHISIVTRYIINPSREARARSRSRAAADDDAPARKRINLATASKIAPEKGGQRGTGGTALIPFLKQARDETSEPAVEEWTRRFMKRKMGSGGGGADFGGSGRVDMLLPQPAAALDKENVVDVKGLAWSWTMEDDVGGICMV
ncbi:Indoleamine 2,3-dioxygenase [Purpureocillium takamizusanense]|uniref:Indoleamine 2,3-dioxygenase n=1 Tax=Purpureocillium takamizusanense TaxID=2060973 RepID=A0A9Q8QAE3_9HYPO|nr:Indoleamine 2,3-dioxygenase [Purpureocillium takamizusanense]UNI15316.1 Indoleamine 2,3-dioxygenase [Purpureocillium takamizusanense]